MNGFTTPPARVSTSAAALPAHATIMAFDFGEKRIGVATANITIGVANALTTIHAESNADRLKAVGALVREWQPQQFVVGQPKHIDGAPHEVAHLAKKFGNRLTENFKLPVAYVDETLSSAVAAMQLAEQGIRGRNQKEKLDAMAAQVILQAWLNEYKGTRHAA